MVFPMADLAHEIWRDDADNPQAMSQVSLEADMFRLAITPNATLVHTFVATSDFDAFQKNYDWNGWGVWRPEPHWIEQPFTDEEEAAQQVYLDKRNVR
jgi:hypothetical protein